jgi:predicted nucleic acid-binding protein
MDKVIIDTSAWIESFRPTGPAKLIQTVKELILSGKVLMPGIIKAELLRGAKTQKEYDRLEEMLQSVTRLPVLDDFWERAAKYSFSLYRKGIAVPLVDTVIALLSIENKAFLLHCDKHFGLIAGASPLLQYTV